jgi:hypothetical protein
LLICKIVSILQRLHETKWENIIRDRIIFSFNIYLIYIYIYIQYIYIIKAFWWTLTTHQQWFEIFLPIRFWCAHSIFGNFCPQIIFERRNSADVVSIFQFSRLIIIHEFVQKRQWFERLVSGICVWAVHSAKLWIWSIS